MKQKISLAHLALLFVALIYGANYSIAKFVLDPGYLRPEAFVLLRIAFGFVAFSLLHRIFVGEKVERSDWKRMVACGFFGVAANQMFFLIGLRMTTPIHASLIMTTTPILVLIVAAVMAAERLTVRKAIGVGLGMAGASWLILMGAGKPAVEGSFWGDFFVFVNASCYGIYLVLVNRLMQRYHPLTVVRWVFTFGLLFVLPFSVPHLPGIAWHTFGAGIWASVAFVLVATTFLAYLLNAFALGIVRPSTVSIYIYLQPLFAGLISIWLGQESMSLPKVLAAALIFGGVYLVSVRPRNRKKQIV